MINDKDDIIFMEKFIKVHFPDFTINPILLDYKLMGIFPDLNKSKVQIPEDRDRLSRNQIHHC